MRTNTIKEPALQEHIDRVGIEFYSRWKEYKLSELMELIGGGTPKTSIPEYWNGDIPWLSVTDFNTGMKYCFGAEKKITEKGLKESSTKILKKGQIIISARGTVGVISMLGSDMAFNQSNYGVNANQELTSNNFLYYLLKANLANFISASYGAVFDTITKETFNQLFVSLPPLSEQSAIASILSSLDDKIDLLHRQNKTLEQLAETLFRQWFVEESEESWETKPLGTVFDIGIGRTPPRKEQHWFTTNPNDIKWVSIKDMGASGIYIDTVSEYLTHQAVETFSVPIIPENTVMLSFKMTIGRLAITTEKMVSNEAIAHFKQKENSFLFPEFLYLFLKTYSWEQLGSTSSIVEAINSQMIKEIEMIIPDEQKLNNFKALIKPYFQKIKSNQTQIRTLTQLRDTLLPKLMSGEVRVKMNL